MSPRAVPVVLEEAQLLRRAISSDLALHPTSPARLSAVGAMCCVPMCNHRPTYADDPLKISLRVVFSVGWIERIHSAHVNPLNRNVSLSVIVMSPALPVAATLDWKSSRSSASLLLVMNPAPGPPSSS